MIFLREREERDMNVNVQKESVWQNYLLVKMADELKFNLEVWIGYQSIIFLPMNRQ